MKNFEDYQSSGWIKRITNYEDLREQEEYFRLECERKDDNIIRQINELNTKVDALLFAVNTLLHSETNKKGSNSKKKTKVDKLVEEDTKIENKPRKRGRPKKIKGE